MTTQEKVKAPDSTIVFGKFSGKFSEFQQGLYNKAINYLEATEQQAHRLCCNFAADWGKFDSNFKFEHNFNLGSVDKEGNMSVGEDTKGIKIKVACTPALSIAKLIQEVDKIRKYGFVYAEMRIPLIERLEVWLRDVPDSK